jgi:FkbH-like protein
MSRRSGDDQPLLRAWRTALDGEVRIDRYARGAREIEALPAVRDFPVFRILVLSSFTIQNLEPMFRVTGYLSGVAPQIEFAPPDQLEQALLAAPEPRDLVIVAVQAEDLAPALFEGVSAETEDRERGLAREALEQRIASLVSLAYRQTGGLVLFHNFVVPTDRVFGVLEPRQPATPSSTARDLNRYLEDLSRQHPFLHVLDVERLASLHGKAAWRDPRFWYSARLALINRSAHMVMDEYGRFIRAIRGHVRKCLVLDCDNTLWGGTVGEDGLERIQLGDAYPGLCYRELQREVLALYRRGVLLAIASKNTEADVLEVLDRHPAMLLRRSHFAAVRVNWQDKATNLIEIAEELDLGLDSLVFVDDEPAEIERIRRALPEVHTVHLGRDPWDLLRRFRAGAIFDTLSLTDEDRARPRMYAEQRRRRDLEHSVCSLEEFYAELQMRASIRAVSRGDIARASQLTQRTNQFTLTARRYSEADIARMRASGRHHLFAVDLSDRFGTYGTVALLVLASAEPGVLEIDTFLLSCRVIGRTLEESIAAHAQQVAHRAGFALLRGIYRPTAKNHLVSDLYPRLGFAPVEGESPAGESRWARPSAMPIPPSPWIRLDGEESLAMSAPTAGGQGDR